MLRRTAAFVFAASAISACRPSPRAEAPTASVVDDLDAIEAELSRNATRLQAQGIRLAAAAVPPPPAQPATDDPAPADAAGAPVREPEPETATETDDPIVTADEDDQLSPPPEPSPVEERDYEAGESPDAPTRRKPERAKKRRAKRSAASRCERICDLAEATCDLSDRICGLANTHVDEIRYANACQRAEVQCEAAANACTECAS